MNIKTLPKASIYLKEMRQFSKVREVAAVNGIKVNETTNLPLMRVLKTNFEEDMRGYVVKQPAHHSRLCT